MKEIFTKENIRVKLSQALSEGRIITYYQPQYDALTELICGAEALVRWRSITGEIVPPIQFIPLLEHNGDVTRVDWYVLGSVCRFLHDRRSAGQNVVPIAVNFSRVHIHEEGFLERLVRCVDSFGLPHSLIHAEITESALAGEPEETVAFITAIREAGFPVAIDDFGSGLSSLNFVKDVPANILKIDKSLLSHNCENEKERIVLESIFGFSHRLGMSVVTEGVETKEQLGFLRTCGCETIQGYYFAKPMPKEEFILAACARGETQRRVVTRQKGDDGIYRNIESTIYYVKSPSSQDVLGISLSREV